MPEQVPCENSYWTVCWKWIFPYPCKKTEKTTCWCYDFSWYKEYKYVFYNKIVACEAGIEYSWSESCLGFGTGTYYRVKKCFTSPRSVTGACHDDVGTNFGYLQSANTDASLLRNGIWNPGTHGQFVVWGWTPEDFEAKQKELWDKGMRLIHQQAYMVNGQKLYDGIWNPGTHGQFVVWGWAPEDFEAKYSELLDDGMRLIHQQAYMVNGQKLYDGIWNPGTHGQFVVWGWAPEDFEAKYSELLDDGMRLIHQQALFEV